MNNQLEDKVILVTGAGQGLGAEVAFEYAKQGATVILLGRNNRKLEQIYDRITDAKLPEPFAVSFDLLTAVEEQFNQLAMSIMVECGRLDGIVHCASYLYALSPIEYQTVSEWVDQYRINTVAPMALTRAFLPALKESPDSSVIFVSESHSQTPKAYWGAFGASKAALNYLSGVLADEWSRFDNFRANILIPGNIHSPQRQKTHPGESETERKTIASIIDKFVYWSSQQSRGRSGEIVYL